VVVAVSFSSFALRGFTFISIALAYQIDAPFQPLDRERDLLVLKVKVGQGPEREHRPERNSIN